MIIDIRKKIVLRFVSSNQTLAEEVGEKIIQSTCVSAKGGVWALSPHAN